MSTTTNSGTGTGTGAGAGRDALSIEKRADGVFVIRMDVPGEAVNTLRASFAKDFAEVFGAIEHDAACKAIVFTSGKKSGFIAGADIAMLKDVKTSDEIGRAHV